MKEDMYTYHYYKNKSIMKPNKTADYLFQAILVSSTAFGLITLFHTFR